MPANFAMQLEAFAKAIQSGNPTPVSGEVGLEAVRTLLGIYAQSSERLPPPFKRTIRIASLELTQARGTYGR